MTKVRSGNRSRRWCAAPMPETPAPTMRTSTWPASWISTVPCSVTVTGEVVVIARPSRVRKGQGPSWLSSGRLNTTARRAARQPVGHPRVLVQTGTASWPLTIEGVHGHPVLAGQGTARSRVDTGATRRTCAMGVARSPDQRPAGPVGASGRGMSCALPKTLPGTCRRWPLTLRSWRTSCTCSASCAVGARRSGRVRIGRTAPGCHVSFDSTVLFDVHREGGGCLRPQVLGLVATKNGIWREQASTRRVAG